MALALGLTHSTLALAQGQPLSPYDISRVPQKTPPAPAQPLGLPPAASAAAAQNATPRFVLREVQFDGAATIPPSRLTSAWTDYRDKPVSLADLRAIGRAAEHIYADAGYPFVAVVLKVQEVQGGIVHYDVIEGRITDLTILGSDPTARRQATAALQPLVNRQPLSLAEVESAYEIARRVPGLNVAGALRRGSEPGGMDLVVTAKRDEPWRFYANVNNLYADPVGPWGVLAGADYTGSTQYGDQGSAQVYTSVPTGQQVLARGSYFIGLDSEGTQIGMSGLWGKADPKGQFTQLQLAADIATGRVEISQPLIARPDLLITADVGFDVNNQRTQVFGNESLSNDKLRIISATLTGEAIGPYGQWDGSVAVRRGLDVLGASNRGDPNLSRVDGDPQATVLKASLHGETPALDKVSLVLKSDFQYSGDRLLAPDQYTPGNLSIGRGYQPGAAVGDSAAAGSIEVRVGPYQLPKSVQAEPFVFLDSVYLKNNGGAAFDSRALFSFGGGVRLQLAQMLHVDVIYAVPEDAILPGGAKPPSLLLLNLTIGLNEAFSAIHRSLESEAKK